MRFASLPMYDLPELRQHHDAFWRALRRRLGALGEDGLPEALERGPRALAWSDPDLLFSQTCGYPLTRRLRGQVRYIATPCYEAHGCVGAWYRSAVMVRADAPFGCLEDLRGGVCAFNDADSHSGYNALRALLAPIARGQPLFRATLHTGAHVESLAAVARGEAQCCAVDCVTLELLRRHRPAALRATTVLAWTRPAPGLPWVAGHGASDTTVRRLRRALTASLTDPQLQATRAALGLRGLEVLPLDVYGVIVEREREAARAGYDRLA